MCLSQRGGHLALVPLPSIPDYTKSNGWTQAWGGQVGASPIFRGSDHYILDIKPEGALQYRNGKHLFFWEGLDINNTEMGWRGLVSNQWLIQLGARHEIVIPSGRSEEAGIKELPHRGSHFLGVVDVKYALGYGWQNWVSWRLSGGPSSYGWQSKIAAGHNFGDQLDNYGSEVVVFSTFGNADNINNYFGVSEVDSAASGLTPIDLDSGFRSIGLDFYHRRNIGRNSEVSAKGGIEIYSDDIEKSDLVEDSSQTYVNFSIVWRW